MPFISDLFLIALTPDLEEEIRHQQNTGFLRENLLGWKLQFRSIIVQPPH
jgi:hypothetical protein